MENQNLEIFDICTELEKLALSGVFSQRTADACAQAALLLTKMREAVFERTSEAAVVERLRRLLVEQGEG
jgi:hypothetical protein